MSILRHAFFEHSLFTFYGNKLFSFGEIISHFGLFITFLGFVFLSRLRNSSIDQIFGILMVFTACVMAFAHGSNDTANAVGPVAAVFSTVMNEGVSLFASVYISLRKRVNCHV